MLAFSSCAESSGFRGAKVSMQAFRMPLLSSSRASSGSLPETFSASSQVDRFLCGASVQSGELARALKRVNKLTADRYSDAPGFALSGTFAAKEGTASWRISATCESQVKSKGRVAQKVRFGPSGDFERCFLSQLTLWFAFDRVFSFVSDELWHRRFFDRTMQNPARRSAG
jgi:hypothetical protein